MLFLNSRLNGQMNTQKEGFTPWDLLVLPISLPRPSSLATNQPLAISLPAPSLLVKSRSPTAPTHGKKWALVAMDSFRIKNRRRAVAEQERCLYSFFVTSNPKIPSTHPSSGIKVFPVGGLGLSAV